MSSFAPLAVPMLLAFVTALAASAGFRIWAVHRTWLDYPNERSSHTVPTPRGGGVGIVIGFLLGLSAWVALGGPLPPRALGWLAGALLVAGVSLVDDVRPLPVLPRLVIHLAAAVLVAVAGAQGGDVPLVVAIPLAFLWLTLITNVFNFMDGIDGIASAQAVSAGAAYAVVGTLQGNPLIGAAGALVAASALGFLPFNLPRARLFMGDVGSTFLGFTLGALALLGNLGVGGARLPFAVGVIALAPFLFDAGVTLARRLLRGERWFEPHRTHYYQRLVRAGRTHGQVSALYAVLGAIAAVAAVASAQGERAWTIGLVAAFLPMLGVVAAVWRLEQPGASPVTYEPHPTNATSIKN